VYSVPTENKETVYQRTFYSCQNICNSPGTLEKRGQSMIKNVHACVDSDVEYFGYFFVNCDPTKNKNLTVNTF